MTTTAPPNGVYAAPFALVPEWVYRRLESLPPEALRLYVWLGLYVAGAGNRGYKRLEDIAIALGISESTVKRRLKTLRDAGVLAIRRYRRKSGQYGQNVYYLLRDDPALVPPEGQPPGDQPRVTATDHAPGDHGSATGHEDDPQPVMPDLATGHAGDHLPATRDIAPVQPRVTRGQPEVIQDDPWPEVTQDDPSINPEIGFTQRGVLRTPPSPTTGDGAQPTLFGANVIEGEVLDPPTPEGTNAGVLTRRWIDRCETHGVRLTLRHIKRYAQHIKSALDQGFTPELIWQALELMLRDRVIGRPALLDNYLVRVQTGPELPPERLSRTQADLVRRNGSVSETEAALARFLDGFDPSIGTWRTT